jgi:Uma2 family endonuclease
VVEILSPSNIDRLMFLKFDAYLNAGVRKYWILNPEQKKAQVHVLHEGHYISSVYKKDAVIQASMLPSFGLDLANPLGSVEPHRFQAAKTPAPLVIK